MLILRAKYFARGQFAAAPATIDDVRTFIAFYRQHLADIAEHYRQGETTFRKTIPVESQPLPWRAYPAHRIPKQSPLRAGFELGGIEAQYIYAADNTLKEAERYVEGAPVQPPAEVLIHFGLCGEGALNIMGADGSYLGSLSGYDIINLAFAARDPDSIAEVIDMFACVDAACAVHILDLLETGGLAYDGLMPERVRPVRELTLQEMAPLLNNPDHTVRVRARILVGQAASRSRGMR